MENELIVHMNTFKDKNKYLYRAGKILNLL